MKRHANLVFGFTLLGLDIVMTSIAFYFAHLLRVLDAPPRQAIPPFSNYLGMMLLNGAAIIVVFFFYKLYHLRRGLSQLHREGRQSPGFGGGAAEAIETVVRAVVAVLAEDQKVRKGQRGLLPCQQLGNATVANPAAEIGCLIGPR